MGKCNHLFYFIHQNQVPVSCKTGERGHDHWTIPLGNLLFVDVTVKFYELFFLQQQRAALDPQSCVAMAWSPLTVSSAQCILGSSLIQDGASHHNRPSAPPSPTGPSVAASLGGRTGHHPQGRPVQSSPAQLPVTCHQALSSGATGRVTSWRWNKTQGPLCSVFISFIRHFWTTFHLLLTPRGIYCCHLWNTGNLLTI